MKEISIIEPNFYLEESLISNAIFPITNVECETYINGNTVIINSSEDLDKFQRKFLVAYDKKLDVCLAIQELSTTSSGNISCELSKDFLATINAIENFKYARLCIAAISEDTYTFFYITSSLQKEYLEKDNYIGTIEQISKNKIDMHLIAYYSKNALLSIKYIPASECYKKFINCVLETISFCDDQLILQASCFCTPNISPELVWVSRTTGNIVENIPILKCERKPISITRELLSCNCNFRSLTAQDADGYILMCKLDNDLLDITLSENMDSSTMNVFTDIYTISNESTMNLTFSSDSENHLDLQVADHIYPYMFSIVMAVYNTEQFLEEALDSIVNQDLSGLKEYIVGNPCKNYCKRIYKHPYQVIMVDDGATDSSGEICDEYASEHDHFSVIHKENGGVSSARNAGIRIAEGKYLNFMDSDDKFSNNVLKECFHFFENHYEETDMITFPIRFFDAATGDHWLNGKFNNRDRIIHLIDEHDKSILFVNASMFKAEKIKNKIMFDESLTTGEDVRFIYSLFFKEGARFGVLNKCTYWYRRRSIGEPSAIQASKTSRNFYFEYLTNCMDWLLFESKKYYGFIPQYVQYLVAQQLQWRFKEDADASIAKTIINESEFMEYEDHIRNELKYIDTDIILEQKKIFREQKKYILEFKTGQPLQKFYDGKDVSYFFEGKKLATASTNYLRLEFLKFSNDSLYIEGYNMSFEKDSTLFLKVNDDYLPLKPDNRDMSIYALGHPIFFGTAFRFELKLDTTLHQYDLNFYEKIDGQFVQKTDIRYAKTMPLSKTYSKSYYAQDGWVARFEGAVLSIKNMMFSDGAITHYQKYEDEFTEQVSKKINSQTEKAALALRKELIPTLARYRQYKTKKIWLISDRVNMAGDNGEAFFRYMLQVNNPEIELYFVINENCPDYNRMKSLGNVVVQNSKQHKLLHFLAEYIISSQANEYVINPFFHEGTTDILRDHLYRPKFVFLQHGVIKDDLSDWLNRFKKDLTGFVTAAIPEFQSILDYNYFYSPKEVWLTGLPRHDRLYNAEKKYITIMPTWRKYLSEASANDPEVTVVKNNFDQSEFFQFYNRLINDKKLLDAASKTGYTICFMPHPNIMNNLDMFDHNPQVIFFGTEKPYREIFAESNLVMTDYSSSVMDFAYLRKPIVYCHFDQEEFFAGDHVYTKGYFDYERDGFGEVTYDLESLVNILISYMENNCQLKKIYSDRMDAFFAFKDHNNCERLYQRLLEEN